AGFTSRWTRSTTHREVFPAGLLMFSKPKNSGISLSFLWKFGEIVIAEKFYLACMSCRESSKLSQRLQSLHIIVRPRSRQCRNGMVVVRQFNAQIVGVPDIKQPLVLRAHRDSAMPVRVPEQRN